MKTISFNKNISSYIKNTFGLISSVFLMSLIVCSCTTDAENNIAVSTLTRPTAITLAVIDWQPSENDLSLAGEYEAIDFESMNEDDYDEWEEYWANYYKKCLALNKRAFAFVANSGSNSVARIDLCTDEVENSHIKGNPFVVSHIAVGKFPVDVATSIDDAASRVFVSNAGESTLSVIQTKDARTLQDKTTLSSRPSKIIVVKSDTNDEGDVYVGLPNEGKLARIIKSEKNGRELWIQDVYAELVTDATKEPVPGGMSVDPAGKFLYVADMKYDYFHIVDLENPEQPAQIRNVYSPQRSCSVSPDGRFLYLAKLDQKKIAVFDILNDKYIDTNDELPSHRNQPPPSEDFEYDIEVEASPRAVIFVDVIKKQGISDYIDGDATDNDATDNEATDSEVTDGDAEISETDSTDGDIEVSEGELEATDSDAIDSETTDDETSEQDSTKFGLTAADGDADFESEQELDAELADGEFADGELAEEKQLPKTFAYSIGYNGNIQVIDVNNDLHEPYDTSADSMPEIGFLNNNELKIDNNMCIADIDAKLQKGRVPDALWEMYFNGLIPESDKSVSGRFEFAANHFVDDNRDFSTFEEIMQRPDDYDEVENAALKGDWLEIITRPKSASGASLGCTEEIVDLEGNKTLVGLDKVRLEILSVTPDYLEFDPRGINLENCFNTSVSYKITANNNYLVYMTKLDTGGSRIGKTLYQGRATNVEFSPSDVVSSEEQYSSYIFEDDDYRDYVCELDTTLADGSTASEYRFKRDMQIENSSDSVNGMKCLSSLLGNDEFSISFENDYLSFAICQDIEHKDIELKRQDTFLYSFRSFSGINKIHTQYIDDVPIDGYVGSVLEDAVFLDLYPGFPRLYVVDSTDETVYIIDLTSDDLVGSIQ